MGGGTYVEILCVLWALVHRLREYQKDQMSVVQDFCKGRAQIFVGASAGCGGVGVGGVVDGTENTHEDDEAVELAEDVFRGGFLEHDAVDLR
jgi:hypothetical protein